MKVIKIRYVRMPFSNKPIGCVVLLDDGRIGWSQCCPKDQFCKQKGKDIAIARALRDTEEMTFGTDKVPVDVKALVNVCFVNGVQHNTIKRLPLVQDAVVAMYNFWVERTTR